jgi:hypothetical protein
MTVGDFFCSVYIFPSKEYLINNVGWMNEANIQKCHKCRLVVHVINFDPLVMPRSPTTSADTAGESGVTPLSFSSIEPYVMPTIPPYHRMVGLIEAKPA